MSIVQAVFREIDGMQLVYISGRSDILASVIDFCQYIKYNMVYIPTIEGGSL